MSHNFPYSPQGGKLIVKPHLSNRQNYISGMYTILVGLKQTAEERINY